MAAWDNDPIVQQPQVAMPWDNDPIVSSTGQSNTSNPWEKDQIVSPAPGSISITQDAVSNSFDEPQQEPATQPEKPEDGFLANVGKAEGEALAGSAPNISFPPSSGTINVTGNENPLEAYVRQYGNKGFVEKVGEENPLGPLMIPFTPILAIGSATGKEIQKQSVEPEERAQMSPEQIQYEQNVAGAAGEAVAGVGLALAPLAHDTPEAPINRSNPPILDSQLAMQTQNEALANLSMSAKQPWKKTADMATTTLGEANLPRSIADINADIKEVAANTAAPGAKDRLIELQNEKAQAQNPQLVVDNIAREPNNQLTDEQVHNNIKLPVQNALDAGVPVDRVRNELEASLPKTLDNEYRQFLIDDAIPPSAKNTAAVAPEIAKATDIPSEVVEGLLLPKEGGVQDTTSTNVVKDAIDNAKALTAPEAQKALGNNKVSQWIKGKYNDFQNSFGVLDDLNRVWANKNGIDIGRNDILELADTNVPKNINDRSNEGGLSYLGAADGSSKSIFRNQEGTSQLLEDTDILPYNTVKTNAIMAGLDNEALNKINLSRNALDDYANIDKTIADSASKIAENNIKIQELQNRVTNGIIDSIDNKLKIRSLVSDNYSASQFIARANKKQTYMSRQDALAIHEQFKNNPGALAYIEGLNKIHQALLEDLVTAGKITPQLKDRLIAAHPNYIPAFRDIDDYTFDIGNRQGWSGSAIKAFLKREIRARGAEQVDPEGNIIRNILSSAKKRESSQIRSSIFENLYKIMGDDAWELAFREPKKDVAKALEKLSNGGVDKLTPSQITPVNPDRVENYNTVSFDINGRQLELSIKDENLFKSIANAYGQFDPKGSPLLKGAIFLSKLKRAGIIDLDPTFPIRNAMRGVMDFPVNSRRVVPIKDYVPLVSQIKTAAGTLFDKAFYEKFATNYGYGSKVAKDYGSKSTEQIVNMVKGNKVPGGAIHNTLTFMHDVNSRVDAGTRILQYKVLYKKLVEEGKTPAQAHEAAMIAAKEAHLRFNQRGNNNAINLVTQTIPLARTFLNAMDKSLKMGLYSPVTFSVGSAQIFMVYKAIQAYNSQYKDTDGIPFDQKLDPRIKKDAMPIYYGNSQNSYFKYPLGWIWGRAMPAFDKTYDYMMQYVGKAFPAVMENRANELVKQTPEFQGKVTGRQVTDAWMDWAFKWMTPEAALPPALGAVAGLYQNKDEQGHPIVPQTMLDKSIPSHLQYFTSNTDASLVDFTNTLHTKFGIDLSPAKAQFVVRELVGNFGETSMKIGAHIFAAASGANPPAPERGDIPGFKLFSGNTSDVPHQGIENKYYNVTSYLKNIAATENVLKQKMADYPESALEYNKFLQDNATELYWAKQAAEVDKQIAPLKKALDKITTATKGTIPGDQDTIPSFFGDAKKRQEITNIREQINAIQNSFMQGIVNHLDKANNPTNDIWMHNEDHAPLTNILNHLAPSENPNPIIPEKKIDNSKESGYNNIFDFINPISDAHASEGEMIPYHTPPAITQPAPEDIQEQYKPGFMEKYLPNIRHGVVKMYRDNIIDYTIKEEGGDKFTQTPGDRGGATKFGITLKTLQTVNPNATVDDVKNMTEANAKNIYQKKFWDDGKIERMPIGVQDLAFDMSVNHGLGGSTIIIQRALNDLGAEIEVDGKLGNDTLNAMNDFKSAELRQAMLQERSKWVEDIAKNDPSQAKFLPGWKKRIAGLEQIPEEVKA